MSDWDDQDLPYTVYQFSTAVVSTDDRKQGESWINGSGASTDLGEVLSHVREDQNSLAGVLLVSDGQPTQGVSPVDVAKELQIPVFTIGVGDTTPMVDVSIQSVDVPTVAVKGENVQVNLTLQSTGTTRQRINAMLFSNDQLVGSKFIQLQGDGSHVQVRFQFVPESIGTTTYRVQLSSLADEINVQNNRESFDIAILKDRYRVAILTGAPNFNTGVIQRILSQRDRIQFDHYVQINQRFRPELKSFWETKYDLLILDNFPTEPLPSSWQRIFGKKLVSHKSALVWIVGPNVSETSAESVYPFVRLENLGTVVETNQTYPLMFTPQVKTLPFLQRMQAVVSRLDKQSIPPLIPGIQVILKDSDQWTIAKLESTVELPALILGDKSGLRYAVWTPVDLHALYYKLTGQQRANLALDLWDPLLGWLMRMTGDQDMYFRLDKDSYQQGERIQVSGNRLSQTSATARAAITTFKGDQKINATELTYNPVRNRWEGQLWASSPGEYRYEITVKDGESQSTQSGTFRVQESQIELNHVYLNHRLLTNISLETGGKYVPWNQRRVMGQMIQPESVSETRIRKFALTESWWVFALLVGLLTVEWFIRRRLGYP